LGRRFRRINRALSRHFCRCHGILACANTDRNVCAARNDWRISMQTFATRQKRRAIAISLTAIALLIAGLGASSGAQKDAPTEANKIARDEKTIGALIQQLGDNSSDKREFARKRLAAIGAPALPLLEKAVEDGPDVETRASAVGLIRLIRQATAGDGLA